MTVFQMLKVQATTNEKTGKAENAVDLQFNTAGTKLLVK